MNSLEYVEKLKVISPTKEEIVASGITGIQADLIFNSFNINEKQKFVDYGNEVINLISNFNITRIPLFGFTFENPEDEGEYVWVGSFEVFKVGINKKDKTLNAFDITDDLSFFCQCANDDKRFLDSMYLVCEYVSKMIKNNTDNNKTDSDLYKKLCTAAAGGSVNYDFFNVLIG